MGRPSTLPLIAGDVVLEEVHQSIKGDEAPIKLFGRGALDPHLAQIDKVELSLFLEFLHILEVEKSVVKLALNVCAGYGAIFPDVFV